MRASAFAVAKQRSRTMQTMTHTLTAEEGENLKAILQTPWNLQATTGNEESDRNDLATSFPLTARGALFHAFPDSRAVGDIRTRDGEAEGLESLANGANNRAVHTLWAFVERLTIRTEAPGAPIDPTEGQTCERLVEAVAMRKFLRELARHRAEFEVPADPTDRDFYIYNLRDYTDLLEAIPPYRFNPAGYHAELDDSRAATYFFDNQNDRLILGEGHPPSLHNLASQLVLALTMPTEALALLERFARGLPSHTGGTPTTESIGVRNTAQA